MTSFPFLIKPMSQEARLLDKVIVEVRELRRAFNDKLGESSGGSGTTGGATETTLQNLVDQTDQLETFLEQIDLNTEAKDYELDIQERTVDGSTETQNVVGVSITLIGDGGSINGIPLPSNTNIGSINEDGGLITNSISYTVPTSTNGRVIITYNKLV